MASMGMAYWQQIVVLGVALSGVASFVNTYNALSNINNLQLCEQSLALQKAMQTKFIVLIVLSCFALALGIGLSIYFRVKDRGHTIITYGIASAGLLGILYAISIKFRHLTDNVLMFMSWGTFIGFIILGIVLDNRSTDLS